ncbi:MAG: hypothetical protein U0Q22_16090 [Acidimicrobiales bacterium]
MIRGVGRDGSVRFVAVLALVWLAPVVALLVTRSTAADLERSSLETPAMRWTHAGRRTSTFERPVAIEVVRPAPTSLLSPVSGRVTIVRVRPGATLAAGTPLMDVDGVRLLALVGSDSPLYRPLDVGAQGADVAVLHRFLAAAGFGEHAGDLSTYDLETASSVAALQAVVGVPADGTFRPGYLVFVPPGSVTITSLAVTPDQTVTDGATLGVVTAAASSVAIRDNDSANLALAGRGPVVVAIGDHRVPIADPASLTPPEVLALGDATAPAEPTTTSTLTDGSVRGAYAASAGLATATTFATLPASAVVVGASGGACVIPRTGVPRRVTPIVSPEVGVVYLVGAVRGDVLVDATSMPAWARRCR